MISPMKNLSIDVSKKLWAETYRKVMRQAYSKYRYQALPFEPLETAILKFNIENELRNAFMWSTSLVNLEGIVK